MIHPTAAAEGRGLAIPAAGRPVPQSLFSNALRMILTTASRSSNEAVLRLTGSSGSSGSEAQGPARAHPLPRLNQPHCKHAAEGRSRCGTAYSESIR